MVSSVVRACPGLVTIVPWPARVVVGGRYACNLTLKRGDLPVKLEPLPTLSPDMRSRLDSES